MSATTETQTQTHTMAVIGAQPRLTSMSRFGEAVGVLETKGCENFRAHGDGEQYPLQH